jgi:F1F0 ATPase subunit 2
MNLPTTLVLSLLGGIAVGGVYFALLARSVHGAMRSGGMPPVAVVSFGLRLALAAAAFLLAVRSGGWPALVAALAGFLAVRTAVTWQRPQPPPIGGRQS